MPALPNNKNKTNVSGANGRCQFSEKSKRRMDRDFWGMGGMNWRKLAGGCAAANVVRIN